MEDEKLNRKQIVRDIYRLAEDQRYQTAYGEPRYDKIASKLGIASVFEHLVDE